MNQLDQLLSQLGGGNSVDKIAKQFGLDPKLATKVIAALGKAHGEKGNTIDLAATATGLNAGKVQEILSQLGGENALGQIGDLFKGSGNLSSLLMMLDRDGDGNPLNDILGMAKGLFR